MTVTLKKQLSVFIFILGMALLTGCDSGTLERQPLSEPSSENFYSTPEELRLAINATYRNLNTSIVGDRRLTTSLALMSDLGWMRLNLSGAQTVARGEASASTRIFEDAWEGFYQGIAKANGLLQNMSRAEDATPQALFNRIRAEARFLRAYYYHRLAMLYGGVPLITERQDLDSTDVSRATKEKVISFVLQELDQAATTLPVSYSSQEAGRATKGAALALKARVSLYNEQWDTAISAAQRVMDLSVYSLYPDYRELFTYAGEGSSESIFAIQYTQGTFDHLMPLTQFSRMESGYSTYVPSQTAVDLYLCTDGKSISESPLYDPAHPFKNRDPRLKASIVTPGSRFGQYRYLTHQDSVTTYDFVTGERVDNQDVLNPYASFTGYLWRKYADVEQDRSNTRASELDFMLIRYAEVLLTYAEAKVEAGQVDQSVYDAVNRVRERAGMPPITSSGQSLLQDIRRERTVELAFEGFRWKDIRRWGIAEKAMTGPLVGRPEGAYTTMGTPSSNEPMVPIYEGYLDTMRVIDRRSFNPDRDYLWAIPQSELDVNSKLEQNPGY